MGKNRVNTHGILALQIPPDIPVVDDMDMALIKFVSSQFFSVLLE